MADEMRVQVTLTAPVRVSFPQVFEARAVVIDGKEKGEPQFSARFVFPTDHVDLPVITKTLGTLLRKINPTGDFKVLRPIRYVNGLASGDFGYPIKSGDQMIAEAKSRSAAKGKDYRGYEEYMAGTQTLLAKASHRFPPKLLVCPNGKWTQLSTETRGLHVDKFYNGMLAVGAITLAGYKLPTGGWGVTAYLNALGAVDGGEHIGSSEVTFGYVPTVSDFVA